MPEPATKPDRHDKPDGTPAFLSMPPMRYPNEYVWLVFVSGMDVVLTWLIIEGLEGEEFNPVARFILEGLRGEQSSPFDNSMLGLIGYNGLIVFKFCLILFVMLVCEIAGRRNDRAGRRLARFGVGISAVPIVVSFALLITEVLHL
jgi:hypothetical protein